MKLNILIVEDESSISDFVKGELEYEGYEVCIKEDGREGLEEALNNEYDLVILDIMLPSMNGFEICRRINICNYSEHHSQNRLCEASFLLMVVTSPYK